MEIAEGPVALLEADASGGWMGRLYELDGACRDDRLKRYVGCGFGLKFAVGVEYMLLCAESIAPALGSWRKD
jgi:hypothetical protein